MKTSLKDWPKINARIKHVHGLDEHEKILYARSLAATPDERWQMNETYLRSFGLWGRSALKKFACGSGGRANEAQRDAARKSKIENGNWLPDMDLNHDKQIQSLLCYRYTIGQAGACKNVMLSS